MIYKRWHWQLIIFLVSVVLLLAVSPTQAINETPRVLFVASYHPAFPTFSEQVAGIESILGEHNIDLDIEYMDTKRIPGPENIALFDEWLSYKLQRVDRYDIVIVADDNAFGYVLQNHRRLFADAPIIFLGVNNHADAIKQNDNPFVTGVIESISMRETIEAIAVQRPDISRLYAIVDSLPSGQGDLQTFYDTAVDFPQIEFESLSLSEYTFDELAESVRDISETDAILLLSAFQDRSGTVLEFDESLQIIVRNTSVPVYHLWFHGMGQGLVGGKLISHFHQGETAARIALDVLNGQTINQIPVQLASPNQYVFDYEQLRHFDIPISTVPDGAVVLNQPQSFYSEYRELVHVTASVFGLLVLLVLTLIAAVIIQQRARAQIRRSEHKYRTYVDSAPYGVIVLDANNMPIEQNEIARQLLLIDGQHLVMNSDSAQKMKCFIIS